MARKQTRRGTPKRRDPLSYESIAAAYRQDLRARPGGGPFSDYDLVRLRRSFGGRRLAGITDEAVRDYALRREEQDGATLETINGELSTFHAIRQFAVRKGLIKNEDLCRIERRRIPVPAAPSVARPRPGDTGGFGLRRHRWFKPAVDGSRPVAAAPAKPTRPPRIEAAACWSQFWAKYPPDMEKTPDGEPITDTWRLGQLRTEFGLKRSRTAMVRQREKALTTLQRKRSRPSRSQPSGGVCIPPVHTVCAHIVAHRIDPTD